MAFMFNFEGDDHAKELSSSQDNSIGMERPKGSSGEISEIYRPSNSLLDNKIKSSILYNGIQIDVLVDRDMDHDSDLIPGEYEGRNIPTQLISVTLCASRWPKSMGMLSRPSSLRIRAICR